MAQAQSAEDKLQKIDAKIDKIENRKHSILLYETYYEWKLRQLYQERSELLSEKKSASMIEEDLLCEQIIIEDHDADFDFGQLKE